jgi:hypothetical protein
MYIGLHVKYPLFLSDFNDTSVFSTDFLKKTQISNLIKIPPEGAELFCADGQSEVTNFLNLANAPKKGLAHTNSYITKYKYVFYKNVQYFCLMCLLQGLGGKYVH